MEQVEVVDENLKILYTIPKDKAHKKGLLHKTVIAEVINSKGEMLLVQQAGHKQDAGQFVSPVGGHISAGETDEQALIREAKEEIGMENIKYKYLGNFIFDRHIIGRHERHYFIVYEIRSDSEPVLNDESVSFKWFSRNEIVKNLRENNKIFGAAFFPIWKRFYQNRK